MPSKTKEYLQKKMRILYHHRTQGKGVEGIHIMGVVNGLRCLGHEVNIIGPPGTDPENINEHNSEKKKTDQNTIWQLVSRYIPEVFFEILEILYNAYSIFRMLIFLNTNRVDVIYERYALFQVGGVIAAQLKKVAIALEINDAANIERVRSLKMKSIALWFENKIFQRADALVTISTYFKRYLLSYGIDENKINVIPNAINPDLFTPERHQKDGIRREYGLESKFIIGFVGLFVPWQGITFLLDVFSKLAGKYDFLHLLLVGDGPERPAIEHQIKETGLMSSVTLVGYVGQERVPSFVNAFDVAVMPNSNTYRSPVKIFEYMGMSKAIIAPAYSPIQEVLAHEKNALLFEPNNEGELYDALESLIKNKGLLREIGNNARRDVMEKHTWEKNAIQIEKAIHRVRHSRSSLAE